MLRFECRLTHTFDVNIAGNHPTDSDTGRVEAGLRLGQSRAGHTI